MKRNNKNLTKFSMKKPTTRILRVAFLVTLPALLLLHTASSGAQPVIRIAAGVNHSLFLKSDGSLWAMGDNRFGELGDGTTNGNNLPKEIIASNVVAIAGGFGYSLFVKTDGSLW